MSKLAITLGFVVMSAVMPSTARSQIFHDCFLWQAWLSPNFTFNNCTLTENSTPIIVGITHTWLADTYSATAYWGGGPFGGAVINQEDIQPYPGTIGSNGFPEVFLETSVLAQIQHADSNITYSPLSVFSVGGTIDVFNVSTIHSATSASGIFEGPGLP